MPDVDSTRIRGFGTAEFRGLCLDHPKKQKTASVGHIYIYLRCLITH